MKKPGYADLGDMSEDARIQLIGETVMKNHVTIGVVVDDHVKADRYIAKLKKQFPGIAILGRFAGPVKGCVTIKVGPSPSN